ncbi:hypothetical protein BCR34DRAFT_661117 [Clohesyomyces aquaticus]|uniref:Uncharacterized protein n=1 Tax=Clohesyomyces aquaticus TaxID=1231657 RepID=A0A1Y2A3R3_9PLEO|nr:hypothetical protein BCR34DRAFT_661117 [Clohesyomyces aquaticus]
MTPSRPASAGVDPLYVTILKHVGASRTESPSGLDNGKGAEEAGGANKGEVNGKVSNGGTLTRIAGETVKDQDFHQYNNVVMGLDGTEGHLHEKPKAGKSGKTLDPSAFPYIPRKQSTGASQTVLQMLNSHEMAAKDSGRNGFKEQSEVKDQNSTIPAEHKHDKGCACRFCKCRFCANPGDLIRCDVEDTICMVCQAVNELLRAQMEKHEEAYQEDLVILERKYVKAKQASSKQNRSKKLKALVAQHAAELQILKIRHDGELVLLQANAARAAESSHEQAESPITKSQEERRAEFKAQFHKNLMAEMETKEAHNKVDPPQVNEQAEMLKAQVKAQEVEIATLKLESEQRTANEMAEKEVHKQEVAPQQNDQVEILKAELKTQEEEIASLKMELDQRNAAVPPAKEAHNQGNTIQPNEQVKALKSQLAIQEQDVAGLKMEIHPYAAEKLAANAANAEQAEEKHLAAQETAEIERLEVLAEKLRGETAERIKEEEEAIQEVEDKRRWLAALEEMVEFSDDDSEDDDEELENTADFIVRQKKRP